MLSAGRRYRGQEQGLALVMTLFVVALVTILVLEYHFDAAVEIDLATNYASDVQAYHLALAGVRFAQALLQRDDSSKKGDGPESSWYKLGLVPACFAPQQLIELATTGGGEGLPTEGLDAKASADRRIQEVSQGDVGCVSLRITDEDSKLPVNALIQQPSTDTTSIDTNWGPIFQAFFRSFHIDEEVVEALADWMDSGDVPRPGGAERSYYERLPVPYKPQDSRMLTPGELRLVKGLDNPAELAKLFPGATPEAMADIDLGSNAYLTPFGPDPTATPRRPPHVNVNTATQEVLTALIAGFPGGPGNSAAAAMAEEIVALRREIQFKTLPPAMTAMSAVAGWQSTYFRVESIGVVDIVHKKIVAVLQRSPTGGTPPMKMLYFKIE